MAESSTPIAAGPIRKAAPHAGTLLLVEDQVLIRMATAMMLRQHGFHVLEAGSADDAIVVLETDSVDLVCTDIDMPGSMDGRGLARWIARCLPGLPVILVSGVPGALADAAPVRIVPILAKPYDPDALAEHIAQLLQ